jgi:hypothetical protein
VHRADEAGFVRIIVNRRKLDVDFLPFQDHGGAADYQLADSAGAEAAPDTIALRIFPVLQLEKATDDPGKLLCEVLDRALHDAGRFWLAVVQ